MSIAKNLIPGVGVAYSKYWVLSSLYIYNIITTIADYDG